MPLIRKAFKRRHYPIDVIAQCVRWYLTYALSLRNLEQMMAVACAGSLSFIWYSPQRLLRAGEASC